MTWLLLYLFTPANDEFSKMCKTTNPCYLLQCTTLIESFSDISVVSNSLSSTRSSNPQDQMFEYSGNKSPQGYFIYFDHRFKHLRPTKKL